MKKSKYFFCLMLAVLSAALCCCRSKEQPQPVNRAITDITITYHSGPIQARLQYTAPEKMRAILNYLRWISPYGKPAEDPEQVEGHLFQIAVAFSDGRQKVYLQKADRYMRIDGAGWMTIDPEKALTLNKIVAEMKSDTA